MAGNYYKEVQIPVDDVILPGEFFPTAVGAAGKASGIRRWPDTFRCIILEPFSLIY